MFRNLLLTFYNFDDEHTTDFCKSKTAVIRPGMQKDGVETAKM